MYMDVSLKNYNIRTSGTYTEKYYIVYCSMEVKLDDEKKRQTYLNSSKGCRKDFRPYLLCLIIKNAILNN